jgi:hypothetical protein
VVAFSLSRLSDGDLSPLTMYTLRPMRPIWGQQHRGLDRGGILIQALSENNNKTWGQRAIFYFTPGPQGWTLPLGMNLSPRGEICPLGGMFTLLFTLYCLEECRGGQIISPSGANFTPMGDPQGLTSPPWGSPRANFTHMVTTLTGGQSLLLGMKLSMYHQEIGFACYTRNWIYLFYKKLELLVLKEIGFPCFIRNWIYLFSSWKDIRPMSALHSSVQSRLLPGTNVMIL